MSKLTDAETALEDQVAENTKDIAALGIRVTTLESAPPGQPAAISADQVLAALRTALLGSTVAGSVSTSGNIPSNSTPSPAFTGTAIGTASDVNKYPLQMPDNIAPAALVPIGTGPDTLDLLIANSPGQPAPCIFDVLQVKPDGSAIAIAGPLTCTSYVGQQTTGAQHFSIKGPWGPNPKIIIAPAADGAGVSGMFLMGASIDLIPMAVWSLDNSRGGGPMGEIWTYNSNDAPMTLQLPSNGTPPEFLAAANAASAASAPPSFTATPTQISGQTLEQIVAAGGAVTLPAQQIVGDCLVPANENLAGAGMGKTIIDGTSLEPKQDKALVLIGGHGTTVSDLTIQNAYVPMSLGLNAAGIRNETGAFDVTVARIEVKGCQMGMMTQSDTTGNITISNSHFHGNGDISQPGVKGTSAATHNMYLSGTPTAVATLTNNLIEACRDVHEVKSRCGTTIGRGNVITTGGNGCCYDLPNGGVFSANNETWTLPANASDRRWLSHAGENAVNAAIGSKLTLTNILLVDLTGQGGIIMSRDPNAVIELVGVTYQGAVKPSFQGFKLVIGDVTPAAVPLAA